MAKICYTISEVDDSVMMTNNFQCENTIGELLPFSTFNRWVSSLH